MATPRLSICIPAYNRAEVLRATLHHVKAVAQTLPLEIAVSDDASTDHTADVIADFRDQFPHFVHERQATNLGLGRNSLACLRLGTAPCLYMLSDDDRLEPEGLRASLAMLEADPALTAVYGSRHEWDPYRDTILQTVRITDATVQYAARDALRAFTRHDYLYYPMLRRETFQRHCFYDGLTFGFWRLVAQLLSHGPIAVIPDVQYFHAHTVPRTEYRLIDAWYHDHTRADLEHFLADPCIQPPLAPETIRQLVDERSSQLLLQACRFAALQEQVLTMRHYLLRAKANGLIGTDQLLAWESSFLLRAVVEHLGQVLAGQPGVTTIVVEDDPLATALMPALSAWLPQKRAVRMGRAMLEQLADDGEVFVLAQAHETLLARRRTVNGNPAREAALLDWLRMFRLTQAPLDLAGVRL